MNGCGFEFARDRDIELARSRCSEGALLEVLEIGSPPIDSDRSWVRLFIADFNGFALGLGTAKDCVLLGLDTGSGGGGT